MAKNELRYIRGKEIELDLQELTSCLCLPGENPEDLGLLSRKSEYFKRYSFKVPVAFSELFCRFNGIQSDQYVPPSVYYMYILPFLNNYNNAQVYTDKNMTGRLFPNSRQPVALLHNMRERCYLPSGEELSTEEAAEHLAVQESFIIKPSIDSYGGNKVRLVHGTKLKHADLVALLSEYQSDYIVQEVLRQHPCMNKFNASSLNTCRICTHRRVGTGEYVLLGAMVRFGGKGDIRDNSCAGGGFCTVHPNGEVDDAIFHLPAQTPGSLKASKGMENVRIPNFDKAVRFCLDLHKTLPYLDLIGWDVAIGEDGEPVLIEFNKRPHFIGQLSYGPMFGEYTDELMEHIREHQKELVTCLRVSYPTAPPQYAYNWQ